MYVDLEEDKKTHFEIIIALHTIKRKTQHFHKENKLELNETKYHKKLQKERFDSCNSNNIKNDQETQFI